uniref:Uncharacterized protein n=1 Tax=Lygus hesperus TaxID=30085 RepID=A0A146LS23_LYGHE
MHPTVLSAPCTQLGTDSFKGEVSRIFQHSVIIRNTPFFYFGDRFNRFIQKGSIKVQSELQIIFQHLVKAQKTAIFLPASLEAFLPSLFPLSHSYLEGNDPPKPLVSAPLPLKLPESFNKLIT